MKQSMKLILTVLLLTGLFGISDVSAQVIKPLNVGFWYDTAAHQEVNSLIAKDSADDVRLGELTKSLNDYKKSDLNHIVIEKNQKTELDNDKVSIDGYLQIIHSKDAEIADLQKQLKSVIDWKIPTAIGIVATGIFSYFIWHK